MRRACFAVNVGPVTMTALDYGNSVSTTRRAKTCASGAQTFLLLALLPVTSNLSLPPLTAFEPCSVQSVEVRRAVFDEHFKPPWDLHEPITPVRATVPKAKVAKLSRSLFSTLFAVTLQEKRYLFRAAVAVLCGFVIGFERQSAHSLAGVRVCSLVALGTTILFSISFAQSRNAGGLGRAVASSATSVGFLGANIMALNSERDFRRGLTTSCGIWLSAACGIGQLPWVVAVNMRYLRL